MLVELKPLPAAGITVNDTKCGEIIMQQCVAILNKENDSMSFYIYVGIET